MKQMSYVTRWLYSTSHKDIAILYLGYGLIASMVGTGMSVIIRMELTNGNSQFFHGNNQAYNVLITGHAIAMIFLFVMPVIIGAFGEIRNIYKSYYFNNITLLKRLMSNSTFNNKLNNNLCSYLTGLIENNGIINISDNINKSPKVFIIFNNNNYELAIYLRNIFNIGTITKKGNVYIWQIIKIEDVYNLLNYTNGYYRTPKYYLYINAIKWINNYIDEPKIMINYNIYNINIRNNILSKISKLEIKPIDKSNLLNNAWFAGFSDLDNCFDINLNKSKRNESIYLRYSLKIIQNSITSNLNESLYPIMLNIATTFNTNLDIRSQNNKIYYNININDINKLELINGYFNKYKLLSYKYLDYKDWDKLLKYIIINNYKSTNKDVVNLGKEIRNNYNKTRSRINFKHLL